MNEDERWGAPPLENKEPFDCVEEFAITMLFDGTNILWDAGVFHQKVEGDWVVIEESPLLDMCTDAQQAMMAVASMQGKEFALEEGEYTLIGPDVEGNPHLQAMHVLVPYGAMRIDAGNSFKGTGMLSYKELEWLVKADATVPGVTLWDVATREPVGVITREMVGYPWPVAQ